MRLIGMGMFFDGFDIYLAGTVLGVTLQERILDAAAECAVHLGHVRRHDARLVPHRLFRRPLWPAVLYRFNLLLFGMASIAAAFAPNMAVLIG